MITPFGELPHRLARHMTMQEQHEWFERVVSRRQAMAGIADVLEDLAARLPAPTDEPREPAQ